MSRALSVTWRFAEVGNTKGGPVARAHIASLVVTPPRSLSAGRASDDAEVAGRARVKMRAACIIASGSLVKFRARSKTRGAGGAHHTRARACCPARRAGRWS